MFSASVPVTASTDVFNIVMDLIRDGGRPTHKKIFLLVVTYIYTVDTKMFYINNLERQKQKFTLQYLITQKPPSYFKTPKTSL